MVAFVGIASANATSVALPGSWAPGDIALVIAGVNSGTVPSLPGGWTNVPATPGQSPGAAGNAQSTRCGYRVLQAGDTDTGVWTNASVVEVVIYRGAAIGNNGSISGTSANITVGTFTLANTSGSSWIVGLGRRRGGTLDSTTTTILSTNRSAGLAATIFVCDSAAGLASYGGETITSSGVTGWSAYSVELRNTAHDAGPLAIAASPALTIAGAVRNAVSGALSLAASVADTIAGALRNAITGPISVNAAGQLVVTDAARDAITGALAVGATPQAFVLGASHDALVGTVELAADGSLVVADATVETQDGIGPFDLTALPVAIVTDASRDAVVGALVLSASSAVSLAGVSSGTDRLMGNLRMLARPRLVVRASHLSLAPAALLATRTRIAIRQATVDHLRD